MYTFISVKYKVRISTKNEKATIFQRGRGHERDEGVGLAATVTKVEAK